MTTAGAAASALRLADALDAAPGSVLVSVAEAEAEANRLVEESLTDNILKDKTIEKWNGELPKVTGENGMMLDITDIMSENTNQNIE